MTAGSYHGAMGRRLRHREYLPYEFARDKYLDGFGLEEVLQKHQVQVYLCGHEHVMQYALRSGVHNFMCGASGAEVRHGDGLLGGSCHERVVDWLANGDEFGFVAFTFTGGGEQLLAQFVDDSGVVIKEFLVPRCLSESKS